MAQGALSGMRKGHWQDMELLMKKIVFFAVALLGGAAFAVEPAVVKKEGGIGFRFDDNRTVKMWQEMADVFNKYNFPLMYAINTGGTRNLSAEQQACLQKLVKQGHEIMDHTLEHRVLPLCCTPET